MSELYLVIRTADQARKAEIKVPVTSSAADIVQAAIQNWQLPGDTDYTLVNITTGFSFDLSSQSTIGSLGVQDGHILEIQPVLVAGRVCL